jgi:hypothetical protein
MAQEFSVAVDLSDLFRVGAIVRHGLFSNLAQAVENVALTGVERWQRAVHAAPLWQGERDAYMASIRAEQTGPLSWEVISDYRYVEDIETGRPARDLKEMLGYSLKVRVSKAGRRYLVIPMRQNSPGNPALAKPMPANIYAAARTLSASQITGHGTRLSGTGAFDVKTKKPARVRARRYLWGGRLPEGMAPKLRSNHATDPYAGMVRFKTDSASGHRYSQFISFRTMVEGSPNWIVPAKPGLWLARHVADSLQRTAGTDFGTAIQQDIAVA